MIVNLTDPPEVVSVDEAAAALRLDLTEGDALLAGYLLAARELLESDSGRLFGRRDVRMTLYGWADEIELPVPAGAVTSVSYTDADGVEQPLAPGSYVTRYRNGITRLCAASGTSWPVLGADGAIKIDLAAGESPISELARTAIIMLAGYWFDNPGGDAPAGYIALMQRLKVKWL